MTNDYQLFFESLPDPVMILDPTLKIIAANTSFLKLSQKKSDELLGKTISEAFTDLAHVEDLRSSVERVIKTLKTDTLPPQEFSGRYWSITNVPVLGPDNQIKYLLHKADDITEFKQSAENSRALKLIADSVPIHLNYLDTKGRFLFANQAALNWWKKDEKNFVGKSIHELTGDENYNAIQGMLEKVLRGEAVSHEFQLDDPNGNSSVFMNSYIPDFDQAGKVQGFVATGVDLTTIRMAEDNLRLLADSMPQIVWTANPDGFVDYYNKVWYEFTGFAPGCTGNDLWVEILHPDDVENLNTTWSHALKTGEPYETEFRVKKASTGEYRWLLSRARPVRDKNGNVKKWYGSNTDIHDQKMMLENLKLEKDLRDRFVSALSHDLRTPLTAAKMSAQLLLKKGSLDPVMQKLVFRISDNMDRADRMIQDLLDASLINAGSTIPLKIDSCYLNQIAQDVIEEFSSLHGQRFHFRGDEDIVGMWDCDGLHRILDNLVNNAIKYGVQGTPITIAIHKQDSNAVIEVLNFGNPIPTNEQTKLFDLFRRSGNDEQKGWGIGLSLVQGLVQAHQGEIRVSSSDKEGTKFIITLPMGEI